MEPKTISLHFSCLRLFSFLFICSSVPKFSLGTTRLVLIGIWLKALLVQRSGYTPWKALEAMHHRLLHAMLQGAARHRLLHTMSQSSVILPRQASGCKTMRTPSVRIEIILSSSARCSRKTPKKETKNNGTDY